MRISFENICMQVAELISQRSTCSRLKVGTVISSIDYRQIYAWGYNGNATGLINACDNPDKEGGCGCLHSECNACISCTIPRDVIKYVFVTYLPCLNCSKMLLNLGGVKKVYYKNDYRSQEGLDLLLKSGIIVTKLKE